ncbi:MAG: O-antigen ligase family protein [Planctomycetes bacterium]|nr:O-antigen ligase family protein [Planctomycetota bacterium]MBI3833498.1 O-antigen ligase family protein [Planctomycetota bacterium]
MTDSSLFDDASMQTTARPLTIVMSGLVITTLLGSYLLLSAAESVNLIDGAVEWSQESPLRAIVQLLCLNYGYATVNAGDVKLYVLGLGAGLALLLVAIAMGSNDSQSENVIGAVHSNPQERQSPSGERPICNAAVLALCFVLWSFASARWSSAPWLSIGGSILLAIGILWSIALSLCLDAQRVRTLFRVMVIVCGVSALLAIWYYYGRNPNLRAKFPFGNPDFLAAALMPGVLGAIAIGASALEAIRSGQGGKVVVWLSVTMVVLAACLWTMRLCDSRAAYVGVGAGLLAMIFFGVGRRCKIMIAVFAIALTIGGVAYIANSMHGSDAAGRSTTLRFRTYAWSYAWRMFLEHPLRGFGQGGFALRGDEYAVGDVLRDPTVFTSRIDHAHCEWLEILADLGVIGCVLWIAALAMTFRDAARRVTLPRGGINWTVIGLTGILVAILAEESFGVGLRMPEVPTIFFTILGMLWAATNSTGAPALDRIAIRPRAVRLLAASAIGTAGVLALVLTQQDLAAAHQSVLAQNELQKGHFDAAVHLAESATARLSPQRSIAALLKLAEAHVDAAESAFSQARERGARDADAAVPSAQLRVLIAEDIKSARLHAEQALPVLAEVTSSAPGFITSGLLEFRLDMLRANLAVGDNDAEKSRALSALAIEALKREVSRQPFDPAVAALAARSALAAGDLKMMLQILARPMRFNRLGDGYAKMLQGIADNDELLGSLIQQFDEVHPTIRSADAASTWAPEKLRIDAALRFLRGEYATAADSLAKACPLYAEIPDSAVAATSCYAEWSDAQFFQHPDDVEPALSSTRMALKMAPPSEAGRELRAIIQRRMIHYELAAGDEEAAMRSLAEIAPRGSSTELLQNELGVQLRRMCESFRARVFWPPVIAGDSSEATRMMTTMHDKYGRWIERAIELAPKDGPARFIAAQIAAEDGDNDKCESRLREALDRGLNPNAALEFLNQIAANRFLAQGLQYLRSQLEAMTGSPTAAP